jgi:hypothetical protein
LRSANQPGDTLSKVVAHYQDGTVVKGLTRDFTPFGERFHILAFGAGGEASREIQVAELKGVYFVKDLDGDLGHAKSNIFDASDQTPGRKVRIQFKDGEVMLGYTPDYLTCRPGITVLPADLHSNADRCYIVTAATERISFIGGA